ncbi:hypothetical protein ACS0TY_006926 [Phlomoides rotata]
MIWKESFLFQKAKVKWIKEGDVNSSFFHGWINKRIKLNGIEGLLVTMRGSNQKRKFEMRYSYIFIITSNLTGRETEFWNDWWVGSEPLLVSFNRLFRVSNQQYCSIFEMGRWDEGEWEWELSWKRSLNIRETQTVLQQQMKDTWRWTGAGNGCFSTKRAYNILAGPNSE